MTEEEIAEIMSLMADEVKSALDKYDLPWLFIINSFNMNLDDIKEETEEPRIESIYIVRANVNEATTVMMIMEYAEGLSDISKEIITKYACSKWGDIIAKKTLNV